MICKNCGNEIPENATFCGVCGTKKVEEVVEAAPVVEATPVEEPTVASFASEEPSVNDTNFFEEEETQSAPPPKKRKKLTKVLLFAGIPVIAIVLVVVLLFDNIQGFWKKTFSSDSEYLAYVESKAMGGYSEIISNAYGNVLTSVKGAGAEAEIAIELGDTIHSLLPAFTANNMDLSWLKNIKILMDSDADAEKGSGKLTLVLSDQEIISIEYIYDSASQTIYFRCKELFDKYIAVNLGDILNYGDLYGLDSYDDAYSDVYDDVYGDILDDSYDNLDDLDDLYDSLEDLEDIYDMYGMSTSGIKPTASDMTSSLSSMFSISEFVDYLPSEGEIKNILDNYIDVILDQITDNDVVRSDATITANGVTEECTSLELKVTEDFLSRALKAVLEKARNDSDIISIIENVIKGAGGAAGEMLGSTVISEYQSGIDSFLEMLEKESNASNQEVLRLTSYVNDSHEIIGRKISTIFDGSTREILSYVAAENGGDYGFEFNIEEFSFVGKGEKSGDAITAEYSVMVSGEEYLKLGLENFEASLADEKISGAIILKLGSSTMGLLDGEATAAVSMYNPALRLDLDMDGDSSSCAISLLSGDAMLIKLSVSGEQTDVNIASAPAAGDTVEVDEINPADFDINTIINNLKKAGFPTELLSFAQYSMF